MRIEFLKFDRIFFIYVFANGGTYGIAAVAPTDGAVAAPNNGFSCSGNARIGIRCKYPYPIPQPKLPASPNEENTKILSFLIIFLKSSNILCTYPHHPTLNWA